jgi:hypothetical protein
MTKISRRNLNRIKELSVKTMSEQREFMLVTPQVLIELIDHLEYLEQQLQLIKKQASIIDDND